MLDRSRTPIWPANEAHGGRTMMVRVYVVPQSDGRFERTAQAHASNGSDTPEKLQERLREEWPHSRVIRGITDAQQERWYVYREGHWISPGSGDPPD